LMPGGSAGTSFCSGTEISISRLAMGVPPVFSGFGVWSQFEGQGSFAVKLWLGLR
jgi:hypothetical protein